MAFVLPELQSVERKNTDPRWTPTGLSIPCTCAFHRTSPVSGSTAVTCVFDPSSDGLVAYASGLPAIGTKEETPGIGRLHFVLPDAASTPETVPFARVSRAMPPT